MLYNSAKEWREARHKSILVMGMSGLGKTYISNMLRNQGDWFHYSVDYRIGTRYMGEHILDNVKKEAMQTPFLADLLRTDSIYIASNITFNNLAPLSTYLGKPGNAALGGLPFIEYQRRQEQHHSAEVSSLLDTPMFRKRAKEIYGYPHFICDTGGSICEVVDPDDPNDPVLKTLSENTLILWIKGSDTHTEELARRFDKAPKPMCYQKDFLNQSWEAYLQVNDTSERLVNPDEFVRWTYRRAMAHRQPLYARIAENWGISVCAEDMAEVNDPESFDALVETTLGAH